MKMKFVCFVKFCWLGLCFHHFCILLHGVATDDEALIFKSECEIDRTETSQIV